MISSNQHPLFPTEGLWQAYRGTIAGQPMIVRKKAVAESLQTLGIYLARVGVAVRLLEAARDGLPSALELSDLNELEDALALELQTNHDAIHVLTITTSGIREHIFYAKETLDLESRLSGVATRFGQYRLTTYAAKDADCLGYAQFG